MVGKCKPRRLLLLNDLLVCVSVNNKDDSNNSSQKRLTLKWSYPISEIQVNIIVHICKLEYLVLNILFIIIFLSKVIDTLSLPSVSHTIGNTASLNNITTDNLCNEMNHLMNDYQIISRIVELASTLKGTYLVR